MRYENVSYTNKATFSDFDPVDVTSKQRVQELLPGIGVTYTGIPRTTLFAGVHEGFAPPRPDDNLDPLDPDLVPVDPEESTNYELGIRTDPRAGVVMEATLFRIDFDNQIVPGDAIGLPDPSFGNGGDTKNQGVEFGARFDFGDILRVTGNPFVTLAWTHVFDAEFNSTLIIDDEDVNGNRLPYAPRNLISAVFGYVHPSGFYGRFGVDFIDEQFADAANTEEASDDGQIGLVPSQTLYNASVGYRPKPEGFGFRVTATNLSDKEFIGSRVDGIQVGLRRQVVATLEYGF